MELKTFSEKVVDIELDWFGETIAVGIRPGVRTYGSSAGKAADLEDSERPLRDPQDIADMIAYWDITHDGKPWPVTAKNVARLPIGFAPAFAVIAERAEQKWQASLREEAK